MFAQSICLAVVQFAEYVKCVTTLVPTDLSSHSSMFGLDHIQEKSITTPSCVVFVNQVHFL